MGYLAAAIVAVVLCLLRVITHFRRRWSRASRVPECAGIGENPRSQNLDVILHRAEAELAAIDDDVDAADTRIYAFLALNVALTFGLIGLRNVLQPWWWTPVIGLSLSILSFCWALRPRDYDYGPNIEEFYRAWLLASPEDLKTQLIGELYGAIGKNRKLLQGKSRPFYVGFFFLLLTIVAGGIGVGLTTAFHH